MTHTRISQLLKGVALTLTLCALAAGGVQAAPKKDAKKERATAPKKVKRALTSSTRTTRTKKDMSKANHREEKGKHELNKNTGKKHVAPHKAKAKRALRRRMNPKKAKLGATHGKKHAGNKHMKNANNKAHAVVAE